jgi:hypothetical protein
LHTRQVSFAGAVKNAPLGTGSPLAVLANATATAMRASIVAGITQTQAQRTSIMRGRSTTGTGRTSTSSRAGQSSRGGGGSGSDDGSDSDDQNTSRRHASRLQERKSLFSAKDLAGRIPSVNMQKSDTASLYKFGLAVQRYAENKDCNPSLLLDTIIGQGEPNDRNLVWITELFSKPFAERKKFFVEYRRKILPFFSIDKLSKFAIGPKFPDTKSIPARIIGSDFVDHMTPYLMLAKTDRDKQATENLMKSRFWDFLGVQLRQSFESMLLQSGVDPYKLTLEGVVDALKAYANIVGGDVYASPDPTEDYSVLSVSILQNTKFPTKEELITAARSVSKKEKSKGKDDSESDESETEKESTKKGQGRKKEKKSEALESNSQGNNNQDNSGNQLNKRNRNWRRQNNQNGQGNGQNNQQSGAFVNAYGTVWGHV